MRTIHQKLMGELEYIVMINTDIAKPSLPYENRIKKHF